MPVGMTRGLLTDIGTEELAHLEVIATMVYKLLEGASIEAIKAAGLDTKYAVRDKALFPQDPEGVPWTAAYIQAHGDPIADLHEDMAAEQKARATYEHLIRLTDDVDLVQGLQFLREREVVHFQRFGEALVTVQEFMETKRVY
jgi:spore coat protein JC